MKTPSLSHLISLFSACPLFQQVDAEKMQAILALFTIHPLEPGCLLLTPEQPNDYLYLIIEGQLSVHLSNIGTPPIGFINPGEYTGEVSLLDQQHPSAFVVANQASTVMRLHRRYLAQIYEITPVIQHNLLRALCKRIRSGNNSLIYSEHNAHIDSLTKLPNRRWLDHAFQREQQNSIKNKRPLCLIMLDVDFFKDYNDQHGHLAGDAVLQFISQQLRDQLRPHDSLARFGGEEFVILLPNLSLPEAAQVAERLRSCLAKFSHIPNSQPTLPGVTISLGVAEFSPEDQLNCLVHKADQALYQAKQQGRNRVCVYNMQ